MAQDDLSTAQHLTDQLTSFTTSEIITVLVGPNETPHLVHEATLVKKSTFFQKCLESGMKEHHERCVRLPEDDNNAWILLVNFMYTDRLQPHVQTSTLLQAYVLADRLGLAKAQDLVMQELRWVYRLGTNTILPKDVAWVLENTTEQSQLRIFMIECLHVHVVSRDEFLAPTEDSTTDNEANAKRGTLLPQLESVLTQHGDVCFKLYSKILNTRNGPKKRSMSWNPNSCRFHVHERDEDCPLEYFNGDH